MATEYPYYYADANGNHIRVDPFEDAIKSIRTRYAKLEEENRRLVKKNQELRDGVFATDYVKKALAEAEKIRNEFRMGFPMTEEEVYKAQEWIKTHDKEEHPHQSAGAIGGRYTYEFTPTSIGVLCSVRCSCGDRCDLTDLSTL